jgi:hypothetical protein
MEVEFDVNAAEEEVRKFLLIRLQGLRWQKEDGQWFRLRAVPSLYDNEPGARVYSDDPPIDPMNVLHFVAVRLTPNPNHPEVWAMEEGDEEEEIFEVTTNSPGGERCLLWVSSDRPFPKYLLETLRKMGENWWQMKRSPDYVRLFGGSEIRSPGRKRANAERDADIYRLSQEGQTRKQLAKEYGLEPDTIKNIVRVERARQGGSRI